MVMTRDPANFKNISTNIDYDPSFTVVVEDRPDLAVLGVQWRALEVRADGSFFTSWTWIDALLANGLTQPRVVRVERAGQVVALGIFNRSRRWFADVLSLTAVGDPAYDVPYIEHNGPLVDRDCPAAARLWWQKVATLGAAMLYLPGINADALAHLHKVGTVRIEQRHLAPQRSLAPVRACKGDVTGLMSANSRSQIRRAIRAYQRSGPITLERAVTVAEAHHAFEQMAALHTETWLRRGKTGAMSPIFCSFHRRMLAQGVPAGMVDLLTIKAGPRVIGYLYNFRHRGTVSAYQSGFAYSAAIAHEKPGHEKIGHEKPGHEKPGLVCHAIAIRYYATQGLDSYDFLAGAARYKTSFADQARSLIWLRLVMGHSPLALSLRARACVSDQRSTWRNRTKDFIEKFYK